MRIYEHKNTTLIVILLLAIDQVSKYIIRHSGGFYICNQNLAFGLSFSYLLLILPVTLFILIIWKNFGNLKLQAPNSKQYQNPNILNSKQFWNLNFDNCNLFEIWNLRFGILLILSGGISNLIDRLYFGCVIDFIDLKFWPVFNLADVYITLSGIILLFILLRKKY